MLKPACHERIAIRGLGSTALLFCRTVQRRSAGERCLPGRGSLPLRLLQHGGSWVDSRQRLLLGEALAEPAMDQ